ncbi:MAG TPA: HisA/HisF-related TIM barrel protein [Terriglobales bacterium]|jgi:phosphoribosylformimino-5-aminoimidazole carboxamide ribotide isomerase
MLIPSIDLLAGKVAQLVRGEKKALEFESFEPWVQRFASYPIVQLIDLDAAMRTEYRDNGPLVEQIAKRVPCQVGGGVHTVARAQELLAAGARKVIIGSSLFKGADGIDLNFAQALHARLGVDKLIFAVDSKHGKITVGGWKESTTISAVDAMQALEPYCGAFLYTHVDTEGTMTGFPVDVACQLKNATARRVIVAGGIRSQAEVDELDRIGVDAVVGMAIYTGMMPA